MSTRFRILPLAPMIEDQYYIKSGHRLTINGPFIVLNLYPRRYSNCQARARRSFLMRVGGLAGLGLS